MMRPAPRFVGKRSASPSIALAVTIGARAIAFACTCAAAQIKAFEDTWRWDQGAARAYEEVVEGDGRVSQVMQAFRTFLGESDMLAYLAMMAPRLVELRRVMKSTASIYLHCDPTASHYLKMLMDAVFGAANFRNEIVWQRTLSKGLTLRALPDNHDIILSYQKTDASTWNLQHMFDAYDPDDLDEKTAEKYSLRVPTVGVINSLAC